MQKARVAISKGASVLVVLLGVYVLVNSIVSSFQKGSDLMAIWVPTFILYAPAVAFTYIGLRSAERNWFTWVGAYAGVLLVLINAISKGADYLYPLLPQNATVALLSVVLLLIPMLVFCVFDLPQIIQSSTVKSRTRAVVNTMLSAVCLTVAVILAAAVLSSGLLKSSVVVMSSIPVIGIVFGFAPLVLGILACIYIWNRK